MNHLDVYLHGALAGRLERLENAKLRFSYSDEYRKSGGTALSFSLPIRPEPFDDHESRPFFAGLLPEGDFLRSVAREFQVSAGNAFTLLEEIGGECAGAVSLMPAGTKPASRTGPRWLTSLTDLKELIAGMPRRPLTVEVDGDFEELRLSLAGTQQKLPVIFGGGKIGITRGRPPSTHIIKLPKEGFDDLVANEAFCLFLAAAVGLTAVKARPWKVGDLFDSPGTDDPEFLLVTRYDRTPDQDRLHQEDFCQALGHPSELKYQSEGGPDVATCATLIRRRSNSPARDILAFTDALIFNLVIGNHDAHAKNYSLILEGEGSPRLAPLYDLVSTVVYPGLRRKLAMKYGGEYRPEYLRERHFARLADDLGLSVPAFARRASSLCERIADQAMPVARKLDERFPDFADRDVVSRIRGQIRDASRRTSETLALLTNRS